MPATLTYEQACAKLAAARAKVSEADAAVTAALAHQQRVRTACANAKKALDDIVERQIKGAA